jgi:hypothetical protein
MNPTMNPTMISPIHARLSKLAASGEYQVPDSLSAVLAAVDTRMNTYHTKKETCGSTSASMPDGTSVSLFLEKTRTGNMIPTSITYNQTLANGKQEQVQINYIQKHNRYELNLGHIICVCSF